MNDRPTIKGQPGPQSCLALLQSLHPPKHSSQAYLCAMSVAGASSGSSSGGNLLVDAGQLLQELEVGASLVHVLFTVYDIDDSITEKNKVQQSAPPLVFGPRIARSESSKAMDEERGEFTAVRCFCLQGHLLTTGFR